MQARAEPHPAFQHIEIILLQGSLEVADLSMTPLWGRQSCEPRHWEFVTASCMLVISVVYADQISRYALAYFRLYRPMLLS